MRAERRRIAGSRQRMAALLLTLGVAALLIGGFMSMQTPMAPVVFQKVMETGSGLTGAKNLVAAIYLDFRLFDTIFESLLLLVSVIGVSQFTSLNEKETAFTEGIQPTAAGADSKVMRGGLGWAYPIILIFGGYVVVTGMDGPGGGFQGGAVLAAIAMSLHFSEGKRICAPERLEKIEKGIYVLILTAATAFILVYAWLSIPQYRFYMLLMNILIGAKVFSGLFLIYLRFVDGPGVVK